MPAEPSGPPPARLMPQYGGRYMPPAEQWGAEVDAAGLGPSQLVDAVQARQAYDASPAAARVDLARTAGDRGQIEGALAGGLYEQQAQQAERRAALEEQKRAELRAQQAEALERQTARRAALEAETTRYRQAVESARSSEIDPERMWKSKTTGQKVLSTIAVFLGGIAQGLGGMGGRALPNAALERLNMDIDRDIEAQKANAGQKRDAVGLQGTILQMMRQRYDDDDRAGMAAKAAVLDRYASLTESMSLDAASKDARLRGAGLAAEMRRQRDELEKALQVSAIDQEEADYRARLAAGAIAAQAAAAQQAQLQNLGWEDFDTDDARKRVIPGLGLMAYTEKDANTIKDQAAQVGTINDALSDLAALLDRGADIPGSKSAKEYEAKQAVLLSAINVAQGQGAISESDADRVLKSVPNAALIGSRANAKAALEATKGYMSNALRRQAMARGAVPIEKRIGMSGSGSKAKVQRQFRMAEQPEQGTGAQNLDVESLFTPIGEGSAPTKAETVEARRKQSIRETGGAGGATPGEE
jgi:hypothetical protein